MAQLFCFNFFFKMFKQKSCEQRTSSLSSPDHVKPSLIGFGDTSRDWLLLGRRGSGALELLAGLWRQSRDHSERSSFDATDDHTHSQCTRSIFIKFS